MTEVPLAYEQVKAQLLSRLGRQWRPGERIPPSSQLARELGAGQRSTHRAMAELATEGYLVSRRGKGTFVNPQLEELLGAHQAEQTLSGRRVCILMPSDNPDPFISDMARTARQVLEEAGATCHLGPTGVRTDYDLDWLDEDDAAVIINPTHHSPLQLRRSKAWLIMSTTVSVTIGAQDGYDMVSVDEQQGGYIAGQALLHAGCKTPCFIGARMRRTTTTYTTTCETRLRGFEAGFGQPLRELDHRLFVKVYDMSAGARAVADYLKLNPRPDGVFCACDDLAMGFAMGALSAGLEPGRDYKLIGFDGQYAARRMLDCPPLTTVAVPAEEMGRRGGELLVRRLVQPDRPPQRLLLGCSLFEGATAAPLTDSSSKGGDV